MDDNVLKLQQDLRKKLDRLCWIHNEPALHVAEHFAELRRQVDLDAERLLSDVQFTGKAPKDSDVNEKRLEFIRILGELEKRTGHQPKPQTTSSDVYASFEQRVNAFKDSPSSLDDIEQSYVQLAQEILVETGRVEQCILGEQTIIYWPLKDKKDRLGSLVYFGDIFLTRKEIHRLVVNTCNNEDLLCPQPCNESLLVQASEPKELRKSQQVVESLVNGGLSRFHKASKFFFVGKTEEDYSGYSAKESSVDRQFVSYQNDKRYTTLSVHGKVVLNTSANLFDVCLSTECVLRIESVRLESLHANLLPTPVNRLTQLILTGVHFKSFDTSHLLNKCTNLTHLYMQATFSKNVQFDLEFLRPLQKLRNLTLTLPGSSWDFSAFGELTELRYLKLEGSSYFYAEKLPKLSKAALEQILSAPKLDILELCCFDIEATDQEMLNVSRCLSTFHLTRNRISRNNGNSIARLKFPRRLKNFRRHDGYFHKYFPTTKIEFVHNDSLKLNAASFAGMRHLSELRLMGNSIADLPCRVFQDLRSLIHLVLSNNRIRHIKRDVFVKLDKLKMLKLNDSPIELIEANAFAQLHNLTELTLTGCRLQSIDSEMFNGLKSLRELRLRNNLIERIEVVTEDGRRINVAKADLSDEEKQLVKKYLFVAQVWFLELNRNRLEKLDLNCLRNIGSLKHINLSSNMINELSGEVGPEVLSVRSHLDLNDNKLTAIDKSALPKSLGNLNLSKNQLKRLDDDFFKEFTCLSVLNLSENELTWTVTKDTFASGRPHLIDLDLSENTSIQLTERAIGHMPNTCYFECDFSKHLVRLSRLRTLRIRRLTPELVQAIQDRSSMNLLNHLFTCYLSNCLIKSLERKPDWKNESREMLETDHFNLSLLSDASSLGNLDLSGNLIETLDDASLFCDFEGLEILNLSNNRLIRIHRDTFKCLSGLCVIDLSGNSLSSIDMSLFRQLKCLIDLNLSSNGISFLNLARLFRICPHLTFLDLADNHLDERSTAEPIDARMPYLMEKLVLANNRLNEMNFVRDMTRLQHLDLRNNRIETAISKSGENLLGRLRNLNHLDLSGNQIRSLTDDMFAHLRGQLEHLDLSGNPNDFLSNSTALVLV